MLSIQINIWSCLKFLKILSSEVGWCKEKPKLGHLESRVSVLKTTRKKKLILYGKRCLKYDLKWRSQLQKISKILANRCRFTVKFNWRKLSIFLMWRKLQENLVNNFHNVTHVLYCSIFLKWIACITTLIGARELNWCISSVNANLKHTIFLNVWHYS